MSEADLKLCEGQDTTGNTANNEDARELYWKTLGETISAINYLETYQKELRLKSTRLQQFMAVSGTGSLAGWGIWNHPPFPIIWAAIITGTQVVTAMIPYMSLDEDVKAIGKALDELKPISWEMEAYWATTIMNKKCPEEETLTYCSKYKVKIEKSSYEHLKNITVAEKKYRRTQAEQHAAKYLSKYTYAQGDLD